MNEQLLESTTSGLVLKVEDLGRVRLKRDQVIKLEPLLRKDGQRNVLRKTVLQIQRTFWGRVEYSESGCWKWIGSIDGNGRGCMNVYSKLWIAPRLAFLFAYGSLCLSLKVCHSCDNPLCVNPSHLWQGTSQDNMDDMVAKRRGTHGAKNCKAKLSDEDVLAIMDRKPTGKEGFHVGLAKEFGVSYSTIARIRNGSLWTHLKQPNP